MDFSGLILMPLAAVITACWIIGAALFSERSSGFRAPFLLFYGLGVIFMEPWRAATFHEAVMLTVMLVMLAIWIAAGCIIGSIPAALAVWVATSLRRRLGS